MNNNQIKNEVANSVNTQLKNEIGVAIANKNISDKILANFSELASQGQLFFPKDYPVGNALKLAYAKIVSDNLQNCEPLSIANALSEYVIQGLDVSRKQAYFINYGGKLQMMRSYFGDVAVIKATRLIEDCWAIVIHEGDKIEVGFDSLGRETLIEHKTSFLNRNNPIIGAYSVVLGVNGYKYYTFMTKKEIDASWKMSKNQTNNKFQKEFPADASMRTVIRKGVKLLFNTTLSSVNEISKESISLIRSYNTTSDLEYDFSKKDETKYQDAINVSQAQQETNATEEFPQPTQDFNNYVSDPVEEQTELFDKVD